MDSNKINQYAANSGIRELNPMQKAMIANFVPSGNILLLAPTGSGKTLAFLLPLASSMSETCGNTEALILCPSRELAQQIDSVLRSLKTGMATSLLCGGHNIDTEIQMLSRKPKIVIATPGRLLDHIKRESFTDSLKFVRTLIVDEFDKCLEFGFSEEMSNIIDSVPSLRFRLFISATRAIDPTEWATGEILTLDYINKSEEKSKLELKRVTTQDKDKTDELIRLVSTFNGESAIIFCNFRQSAEETSVILRKSGFDSIVYHGALEQKDRERAIFMFSSGCTSILCTTDLAARGLDISIVRHVVHLEMPKDLETFTHRNGRTARQNAEGTAYIMLYREYKLPDFLPRKVDEFKLPTEPISPKPCPFTAIYISKGKKEKISRGDVAGFVMKVGGLSKDEVGIIVLYDHYTLVAVSKEKAKTLIKTLNGQKIKGEKTKVEFAR